MIKRLRPTFPWARFLFGVHSITSLAYEIIWIKMLETRLGMTATALGTVLAIFIAGLGVGSFFISRRLGRRSLSVRRTFVGAQLALAAWSLLFPVFAFLLDKLYVQMSPPLESAAHIGIRAAVGMALLFPPAVLIGLIFPLLTEVLKAGEGPLAQGKLGALYRDGLVWSAIGCTLVPAALIRWGGISGANMSLAVLNALVAAAGALYLPERTLSGSLLSPAAAGKRSFVPLLAVSFLAGACLFICEIAGARFIYLFIHNTFYTQGIVIGVVLITMALGTITFIKLKPRPQALNVWTAFSLALGGLSILPWLLFPAGYVRVFYALQSLSLGPPYVSFLSSLGVLVGLILAVPAFTIGFSCAGLYEIAARQQGALTASIGRVAGWNYAGSFAGALLGTFWMIPSLGLTQTLAWAALVMPLAGLLLLSPARPSRRYTGWGLCILFGGLCLGVAHTRNITFPDQAAGQHRQVLFHREEPSGLIEVFEDIRTGDRFLYSNRLHMEGSDRPEDAVFKTFQGVLPVWLHPHPRQTLVIGLGTGMSLAANLQPGVERLTCIEYSPGIIEASRFFDAATGGLADQPPLTMLRQDGRNFIKLTRDRYDLIIQDLFFPYQTGMGNLYSLEHFQTIRARLNAGGAFAQWVPLHQIGREELRSLVRTFQTVFPHTSLWLDGRFLMLYGSPQPLVLSWPQLKERLKGMKNLKETTPHDFIQFFLAAGPSVAGWSASAPVNTDDNVLIETRTPLLFHQLDRPETGLRNIVEFARYLQPAAAILSGVPPADAEKIRGAFVARKLFTEALDHRLAGRERAALQAYGASYRWNPASYQVRSILEHQWIGVAEGALGERRWPEAAQALQEALRYAPSSRRAMHLLAEVRYAQGRTAESRELFERLLQMYPRAHQARRSMDEKFKTQ
jgi:spermidine synthase